MRAASRAGLAGLGLATLLLAGSREVLRGSAQAEPFRVEVAEPGAVAAAADGLRWRAAVKPAELAGRVVALVDGAAVATTPVDGAIELDLSSVGPGHHLVEVGLTQQGGRSQTITDTVLVGPFDDLSQEPGCALSLTIADAAIQRLVVPALRDRLLAAARGSPLLGPETTLERAELILIDHSVRVRVTLAGLNRVAVDAFLQVEPAGPRGLGLALVWLGPVEFSGQLRTRITAGGAAVGAALTGPFAPLGAVGGYVLTDRYLTRRAHSEVREQLRQGLAQLGTVPLLPERAELLVGQPRSAVALTFCGPVTISAGIGISARLSLRALEPGPGGGPGPVRRGVTLPEIQVPSDMSQVPDVQLDLSIDAVNALLHAWTGNGLLAERVAAADWVGQVDRELQAWTLLTLAGLHVDRPPVLQPDGDGDAWALSFGGLRLDLRGGAAAGAVVAAGRGWVTPRFDPGTGRLELGGRVDRVRMTCVDGVTLTPCFGALLELGDVEARLDAVLAPGTGRLPALDVRGLLQARTRELRPEGLDVAALALAVPRGHPGVLRVTAQLR